MKTIPNFSKFALNGNKLVNAATGKEKACKTGTNKYQLHDDDGKSHTLTIEQIKGLLKPEKTDIKKSAQAQKQQPNEKKATSALAGDKKMKKHEQCYRLYLKGKTIEQIMAEVGTQMGATKRNIWLYTTGKKSLEA